MSRKGRKDDAQELEPAADVPDEARSGAADDAGLAGAGQAGEAETGDAAAGDEVAADAAPAGEMPGAADADANAADGAQPEAEADAGNVDTGQHCADALAYAAFGIDLAREKDHSSRDEVEVPAPRNRIDINVLAAYSAASLAYGTTEEDTTTLPRFDVAWLGRRGDRAHAAALCAAAFLRRDAAVLVQPETLVIHLRRSGFPDAPAAQGRTAVAWKVFAFALAELDALDRAGAEAARRAELAAQAAQGPRPARREELAMMPADPSPLTDLARRIAYGRSRG